MKTNTRMLLLCALFASLTAIGAFLKLPVGPVPISMQFFFTAMTGVLLGPRWGALSQLVYVALGLLGLPIFTAGGGVGYVFQPSFGFLLGLIPSAWVIGALAGGSAPLPRLVGACLAGLAVLYLVGLPYMYLILNVYMGRGTPVWTVLQSGMLLFLPGDFLKIAAVAAIYQPLRRGLAAASAAAR